MLIYSFSNTYEYFRLTFECCVKALAFSNFVLSLDTIQGLDIQEVLLYLLLLIERFAVYITAEMLVSIFLKTTKNNGSCLIPDKLKPIDQFKS